MSYFRFALFVIFVMLNAFVPTTSWAFDANFITHESRGAVSPSKAQQIVDLVHKYSQVYKVNPQTVFKVMRVESRYNPNAKSSHNAVGLMQIIPYWHRDKLQGKDPFNLTTNIQVGIQILAEYIEAAGSEMAGLKRYCGGDTTYAKLVRSVEYVHYEAPYGQRPPTTYAKAMRTSDVSPPSEIMAVAVMRSDTDLFPTPSHTTGIQSERESYPRSTMLGFREREFSETQEGDLS